MKISAAAIVKQMSPKVRAAAEKAAAAKNQSLEKFIEEQLSVQVTEASLSAVDDGVVVKESIRADGWNVRADSGSGGTRVGGGISGRF